MCRHFSGKKPSHISHQSIYLVQNSPSGGGGRGFVLLDGRNGIGLKHAAQLVGRLLRVLDEGGLIAYSHCRKILTVRFPCALATP